MNELLIMIALASPMLSIGLISGLRQLARKAGDVK